MEALTMKGLTMSHFYDDEDIKRLGSDKITILEQILDDPKFDNQDPLDLESMPLSQLQAMIGKPATTVTPIIRTPKEKIKREKLATVDRYTYDAESGLIHDAYKSGSSVGNLNHSNGYLYIHTNGKSIPAHRLAWFLMKGHYPEVQIYHLNGDKLDNRWSNLALMRDKPTKRYQARIRVGGVLKSLGYFTTREEAEAAKIFFKESFKSA